MASFASIILVPPCRVRSRSSVESDFTFTLVAQWDQGRTDEVNSSMDPTRKATCLEGPGHTSLPPLSLFLDQAAVPLLLSIDPQGRPLLSQKMDLCGWGRAPSQLPPSQAREQRKLRKPPLYFAFLLCNQFARAGSERVLEGKAECLGADSPGNSRRTLLRRVRLEKQFHDKPYRMRNVQSCWVAAGFLPPHGGQS